MKYRILGKTGYKVSEIGFGSWAIGGGWGDVSETQAMTTLDSVQQAGINFIDTADIYGEGRSERFIGNFCKRNSKKLFVATKIGRQLTPHTVESYSKKNIFTFVERCCKNLQKDSLDLLQLHTPPTQIYYKPEVFETLDELVKKKIIRHYGVSVEKVEEALKAIEYPNISTIQVIVNMFRHRPLEKLLHLAKERGVGVIIRVPLASGLLTGKFGIFSRFPKNDHRNFNRNGQVFDRGETFAGVDYKTGLFAVKKLKRIVPEGFTLSQFALKWILMHKEVSTVIAGGKSPEQVYENAKASELPKLSVQTMNQVRDIYERYIMPQVHHRW